MAAGVLIGHLKSHEYIFVRVSEVIMPSQITGTSNHIIRRAATERTVNVV